MKWTDEIVASYPVRGVKKTWVRCLREDIESRGLGLYSAGEMAEEKEKFRAKVVLGLP